MKENHYRHLGVMAALSFLAMYAFMYAMVDSFDHVYNNVNQFYMAGLMTAPMVLIELVVMRGMYHDKRLNAFIAAARISRSTFPAVFDARVQDQWDFDQAFEFGLSVILAGIALRLRKR